MRIGINLATEPFRRDRPMLVASAALGVILLATLGSLLWLARTDSLVIRRDRAIQARLDSELAKLLTEEVQIDKAARRPENAEVIERSLLLNQILLRKGISWTRIFADLEKTLPPNVRVTTIRPQVTANNHIYLEMTIAADSPTFMDAFVAKLEQSDVFGSPTIQVQQAPSQTDPSYRYRLAVNYAQKL